VVLPADGAIELRAEATPVDVGLTIDGQVYEELCEGDAVRLRRADQTFQLVDPQLRTFYDTLREKLYWGSSARTGDRRD
jgi:NAD kinase